LEPHFEIAFDTAPTSHGREPVIWGHLDLGTSRELFASPVTFWSRDDYLLHWKRQLQKALSGHTSVLLVKMRDPDSANFLESWTCYPEPGVMVFQNRLIFLEQYDGKFSLDRLDDEALPRHRDTADGMPSEWHVSREMVAAFFDRFDVPTN
jgi:hypothetical protein